MNLGFRVQGLVGVPSKFPCTCIEACTQLSTTGPVGCCLGTPVGFYFRLETWICRPCGMTQDPKPSTLCIWRCWGIDSPSHKSYLRKPRPEKPLQCPIVLPMKAAGGPDLIRVHVQHGKVCIKATKTVVSSAICSYSRACI